MNWIDDAGMILHPSDATGRFQLVNVFDVVRGILACCERVETEGTATDCNSCFGSDEYLSGNPLEKGSKAKHFDWSGEKNSVHPAPIHECFNLVPPQILTYESFAGALRAAIDKPFETASLTVEEISERGIPLPFPLKEEESVVCSGKKSEEILKLQYTTLEQGLRETYLINLA